MSQTDFPYNDLYTKLIQGLHQEAKARNLDKAVLALSGGLNSAVALCLTVRAFGPKNVTVFILPELGLTPKEDTDHAKRLARHFGCPIQEQTINNFLVDYNFLAWGKSEEARAKLRTRVRTDLIKTYLDEHAALLVGSSCKSDFLLGYGTVDGEWFADIHVLGDCFKSEVVELGRWIGLPEELLEKPASRNLRNGQTDELDLGGPWHQIDDILRYLSCGVDPEFLIQKGIESRLVHKIGRLLEEHKALTESIRVVGKNTAQETLKKAQAVEAATLF